jgi:type IV pilus assembly protein PilA
MLQRIRNRKGFTLVELMIVVAIIGILAAIAIPNFLQFRLKAKTSEAKSNLGAIRSTEVAYFAEWNFYIGNEAANPGTGTLDGAKRPWDTNTTFSIIGFAPEGQVYYDYALLPAGTTFNLQSAGFSGTATGDLDDDNNNAVFETNATGGELIKSGGEY